MDFPNPLGLAAGMDKKGEALSGWESLGFGFIEMGVSPLMPNREIPNRECFDSHRNQALVNRMGFNNPGREATAKRLAKSFQSRKPIQVPLFINLGKSKATPIENAHEDYAQTVSSLNEFADAFVINVSSPNTPGLRSLQSPEQLKNVIEASQIANVKNVPMLVKISPDLADDSIIEIVDTARECGCAGIIATNTTLTRPNEDKPFGESGGLSGNLLGKRSTDVIRLIAEHTNGEWPIIGVGGISTADDAWEKITHGACLCKYIVPWYFMALPLSKNQHRTSTKIERGRPYLFGPSDWGCSEVIWCSQDVRPLLTGAAMVVLLSATLLLEAPEPTMAIDDLMETKCESRDTISIRGQVVNGTIDNQNNDDEN